MALPFELVISRNPISQQARRRHLLEEWTQYVRNQARQHWPTEEETTVEPVMVTILYFHDNRQVDIDNVPKPILDAIKGLVLENDAQVTDLICRKRNLNEGLTVTGGSRTLIDAVESGQPFVYMRIEESFSREVIV